MKDKRYTTEQKIRIVREGQRAGTTIADVCREHQIAEQSYYRWKAELGMLEVDQAKHLCVEHSDDQFVDGRSHINGIESFWAFAKHRLIKFKGVPRYTFYLHLKETEFRFNHRRDNVYKAMLKLLREQPI